MKVLLKFGKKLFEINKRQNNLLQAKSSNFWNKLKIQLIFVGYLKERSIEFHKLVNGKGNVLHPNET